MDKKQFVQDLISKMTIEQKVGQCFVIGYVGSIVTPEIINRIKKYNPAGIRAGLMWRIRTVKHDPNGTNTDYAYRLLRPFTGTMKDFLPDIPVPHFTNEEFCEYVNTLKQAALDRELKRTAALVSTTRTAALGLQWLDDHASLLFGLLAVGHFLTHLVHQRRQREVELL